MLPCPPGSRFAAGMNIAKDAQNTITLDRARRECVHMQARIVFAPGGRFTPGGNGMQTQTGLRMVQRLAMAWQ